MNALHALPEWAAILVALCLLAGALITLAGTIGLTRFPTFYQRIHAPTLGTSFGAAFILVASMIYFSVSEARPVLHELLILIFVTITTPITLMLLARAALYRDRAEGHDVAADAVEAERGETTGH
ncbi:monovalent cation/H(+) antiporter subunit G [Devosia sp. ZB163]|uniref:monovalent cation/H(+) antiporter subunit G n=1 Tax=Devosia sp. ZB163 TaxID=3025938 RepID=UPI00236126CA|nr:monovalent cation/H(+) antiporter subunit G [Devosia sp. ZB163]MDC9826344.1 monovalent cation/H(+) antiporter subunit G [Devosia sp. ZB163]